MMCNHEAFAFYRLLFNSKVLFSILYHDRSGHNDDRDHDRNDDHGIFLL